VATAADAASLGKAIMIFALPDVKMILLTVAVFVPLEWLFSLHREQKLFRKWWKTDITYLTLNVIPISAGINIILFVVILLAAQVMPKSLGDWVGSQPVWLQVPAMILLADLGFYSVHRMFHAVPFLWKFHAVHHSIEEMDWLAAHRVHPLDQICTKGASLIPVFALGFSPLSIGIFMTIYHWQSLLIHSNTRLRFGFLEYILATPRFHHWHHAKDAAAHDKNFAGQFAWLDILFGTLHMPNRMPDNYGTNMPMPESYFAQIAKPVRQLLGRPNPQTNL
jgi:sterol desaturase/sphingolipid hydroxylase (fatty acid hydroxylase superfamily)